MAAIGLCARCDGERYIDNGAAPCPVCNQAVRLEVDDGQDCCFLIAEPVEVQVGDLLFDVRLDAAPGATYGELPVYVIPAAEA
jgi:hypothetical protein